MSDRTRIRMVGNLLLGGWGAALVARPSAAAGLVSGNSASPPVGIVRVLGGRRVVQHLLALAAPTRTVLLVSAATDALHAASMVAAAVIWPRYRRSALVSAGVATSAALLSIATVPPPTQRTD